MCHAYDVYLCILYIIKCNVCSNWYIGLIIPRVALDKNTLSTESQKGAIAIDILYSDSALLVLNGTSLNIDSALLALNWQHADSLMI